MKLTIGPGALVAAAFIGPGTVTTCTLAGANYGFALLWTLVFATFATIILQSMAARLGAGARLGLGEALMKGPGSLGVKIGLGVLVIAALGLGNIAYQSGNISGGALGVEALLGTTEKIDQQYTVLIISALAASLILLGGYKIVEKFLVGLVAIMAISFCASAILVRPDIGALIKGLAPRIPADETALFMIIALIGTTVVPYNLFLHAGAARRRWKDTDPDAVEEAVSDTGLSVTIGGLISIFILATAAASLFGEQQNISNALDMAKAIQPTFGDAARYLIGIGLLAAGFTSAITAPMAMGYALTEVLGKTSGIGYELIYKTTALAVLLIGTAIAISGVKPKDIILMAQFTNGLLLPIITGSLLYAMNRKTLLGKYVNGTLSNILGFVVLALTCLIGARLILKAIGIWP